jgi:DUF1009 family protein
MAGASPKLGILAGAGELPLRVIDACRAAERPFFVIAFEGSADPAVVAAVPHAWIRLGAAGEGLRILRDNGVEELVMAGGVRRPSVLQLRPDWRTAKFFARIGYRALGDDGLLRSVIRELEEVEGFRVVGLDSILGSALAPLGALGRHVPDEQAMHDIGHGFKIVRALGVLDIGPRTVTRAADSGLRGVAVEAGATLIVDRAELVATADRAGLFVVGSAAS